MKKKFKYFATKADGSDTYIIDADFTHGIGQENEIGLEETMTEQENRKEKERMAHLVDLARHRDAEAFSLLYEMVYTDMYRMALYTLGDVHDAEDVVSEAVLDAYQQIHSLRDKTAFRGWIFRILTCKCKRRMKEYVRTKQEEPAEALEVVASAEADNAMQNVLDRQEIAQAFAAVTQEDRLIVTMVVYGGYSSKEIAKILHKNPNTVRSRYHRALDKMQQVLAAGR